MNILFLSNRSLLPIIDGHSRRSYNVLKGLSAKHYVHFVTLYETREEVSEINVKLLEDMCERVDFVKAPQKSVSPGMLLRLARSLFSYEPYTIWRHYSREYYQKVNRLIASGKYDIVHCDNLPIAYTCRHNKAAYRSITDHDVSYLKCSRMAAETNNFLLKLFLYYEAIKIKHLEKQLLKQFDLGIVVSDIDKAILEKLSPSSKFLVIANGVDTEEFKPSDKASAENKKLIWVGGFKPFSNENGMYFFLKDVYQDIKKKVPDIKLDIIGADISKRLNKLIIKDGSIRYLGYVDNTLPYIQNAAVFIVPIISGSGTRLKLLEALAVGKAIVTTTIGCEGIEGVNGIHYLVSDTPLEFSDSIVKLLQNDNIRINMEHKARQLAVDKYDWSVLLDKLHKYYMQYDY